MSRRGYPPERAALIRIQAKLERWELEHLRRHARELAERLEAAQQLIDLAQDRANHAEDCADYWRKQMLNLQNELADDTVLGITRDGALHVVDGTGSRS